VITCSACGEYACEIITKKPQKEIDRRADKSSPRWLLIDAFSWYLTRSKTPSILQLGQLLNHAGTMRWTTLSFLLCLFVVNDCKEYGQDDLQSMLKLKKEFAKSGGDRNIPSVQQYYDSWNTTFKNKVLKANPRCYKFDITPKQGIKHSFNYQYFEQSFYMNTN